MRTDILAIAKRTIPKDTGKKKIMFPDGDTMDIIKSILMVDKTAKTHLSSFAHYLKGGTNVETLNNVWQFVKTHIKYEVDPWGKQYIRTPSSCFWDKCDCKGYSIFTKAVLDNLGISCRYRFASYTKQGNYTHVYIIAKVEGTEYILDSCWNAFNSEKTYTIKKDVMTEIVSVEGLPKKNVGIPRIKNYKKGDLNIKNPSNLTEGKLDLMIAKQRTEIEQAITAGIRGVGCVRCENYQNRLDVIEDALAATDMPHPEGEINAIVNQIENGQYNISESIMGIGSIAGKKQARQQASQKRKEERKTGKANKPKEEKKKPLGAKAKTFLKQAGKTAKKSLKTVTKVVTAPARLAFKASLEILLPKAAPFFLYLFLDANSLAKSPAKVKKQHAKATKIKKFIVESIGMKESHFMGIVRNGIMRKYKQSPEQLLKRQIKGTIAGIGIVDDGLGALKELLELINKVFSKKMPKEDEPNKEDVPDNNTFTELSTEERSDLSRNITQTQDDLDKMVNTHTNTPETTINPIIPYSDVNTSVNTDNEQGQSVNAESDDVTTDNLPQNYGEKGGSKTKGFS